MVEVEDAPGAEEARSVDNVGFPVQDVFDQEAVFVRIVFKVRILDDDDITGDFFKAATKRETLAAVFFIKEDGDIGIVDTL